MQKVLLCRQHAEIPGVKIKGFKEAAVSWRLPVATNLAALATLTPDSRGLPLHVTFRHHGYCEPQISKSSPLKQRETKLSEVRLPSAAPTCSLCHLYHFGKEILEFSLSWFQISALL